MSSIKKEARQAGVLYALACLTSPFSLIYVPRALMVSGDATATASHVLASQGLLRLSIASELIIPIFLVFAALAFYRLFKRVSKTYALAMLILILMSIPISLLNVLNEIAALLVVSGTGFGSAFYLAQRDALVLLFLRLHSQGFAVAGIFWGLWLFPFGILAIRSGFIPRVLGTLMMVAGVPYLVSAFTTLVVPQYAHLSRFLAVLMFGELPMLIWLLVWGAKDPGLSSASNQASS
jgi:hypothetical protein